MGQHDDNDDSIAAGFARRDREFKDWPVGPTPAPSAPRTDEELAWEATKSPLRNLDGDEYISAITHEMFVHCITTACATARAQGRADALAARGEASTGEAPATPAAPSAPATDDRTARDSDLERVAAALWRAWWRTHGESDAEIQFAQLYEGARARWLEIARAGLAAREAEQ